MKYLALYVFFTAAIFMPACKNTKNKNTDQAGKVGVGGGTKKDSASFYLDSLDVNAFLQHYPVNKVFSENLHSFYKKRSYEFAWINSAGINEYAGNFINLLNQEEKKNDTAENYTKLPSLFKQLSDENYKFNDADSLARQLELFLTVDFFDYAERNWHGSADENLVKVGWFIERKKLNYESLLDTLLTNNAHTISSFEPVYRQYKLLKSYLVKYRAFEKSGGWQSFPEQTHDLKTGDTSAVIVSIKKEFFMLGDLITKDSSDIFNAGLESAVKKFQERYGLKANGLISGKTLAALNIPVHALIEQILVNMERCRWIPVEQKGDYLLVNIPAYELFVYHNDSLAWTCNAIVGKSKLTSNTVIFNDSMKYIVFSPYWNIPQSILFKETLPGIKKNGNYLATHNMEVVNASGNSIPSSSINWNNYTSHFPYMIRQKPGKDNALGLVKFLFPNDYDIYMHDTPAKSLFGESTRMFSHGCIRLEEPFRLAQFLLRNQPVWTGAKIKTAMNSGKQIFVKLERKVPVFIAYFTAWVDRSGKLNVREDVYQHDAVMKKLLFAN